MLRSLYSGVSAIKANQVKLDVIGNNIANVGTTAFKGSRVQFKDIVSQSVSGAMASGVNQGGINPKQVGLGVQIAGIDTMVGQGMMQPTSRNLDVAVDGEGYLMVTNGPIKGAVTLDATKNTIVSSEFDISYTRDGALTQDSEGHLLTSAGSRVMGYAINGSISYSTGKLVTKFVDVNGATALGVDATKLIPLSIPDKIETSATPATPSITEKRVKSFTIEKDGVIKAILEDDSIAAVGQIAMASFKNPAGLEKTGGNSYKNTSNSGPAVIRSGVGATGAADNTKGYGDMLQGMLEMSNVDLAEQFTDMIVTQRAFQAAGKTITTGDEILQEILALKR